MFAPIRSFLCSSVIHQNYNSSCFSWFFSITFKLYCHTLPLNTINNTLSFLLRLHNVHKSDCMSWDSMKHKPAWNKPDQTWCVFDKAVGLYYCKNPKMTHKTFTELFISAPHQNMFLHWGSVLFIWKQYLNNSCAIWLVSWKGFTTGTPVIYFWKCSDIFNLGNFQQLYRNTKRCVLNRRAQRSFSRRFSWGKIIELDHRTVGLWRKITINDPWYPGR